jgi:nuclear pore complex protein Nup98-Nup96
LFGSTQQNQQNKPGGLFGNTGTTNQSTSFTFGQNNNQSSTGSGLFGNNQQQQSGGLFGSQNNNQQKPSIFGNSTGASTGFGAGNTQNQASGFGASTNTSGGLFGNQQASTTGGGLFGNTSSNTGGGLFGGQNQSANKPGGLFGGSTLNTNQPSTGGGLFGNNNANTNQSGGLFGNNNNQQPNAFSFNNNQNKPATGGLFGNTSTNQTGGLFSNTNNSSSMFGGSMNQPQQNMQQQDGFKHSSLLDMNPYGQSSIWTGLPAPTLENSKPLVTPLVATEAMRQSQQKPPPSLRLTQSRYMTPPRRPGPGTYGFSYSTYGTPNSAASTPGGVGLSSSMYGARFSGGSFGRSMNKAASVSNLRSQFSESDSILTPGAFSSTTPRYSSGSIRRLHIDRSIKSDLFTRPVVPAMPTIAPAATTNSHKDLDATPTPAALESAPDTSQKLRKRVSFEGDPVRGLSNGQLNDETGALVRRETDDDETIASSSKQANGVFSNGKELAVVPEDRESESPAPKRPVTDANGNIPDPEMGDYWMKPTRAEMKKIPQEQLRAFEGFEVGRHGAGMVRFDKPVDLTNVPWDELFSTIIEIRARSVTVYPNPETKPRPGTGLNVPSTIWIENSWPRAKGKAMPLTSGPLYEKHLARLKKITNTQFVSYDAQTGVWVFTVQHYTTYGLEGDDEDDDEMSFGDSQLSLPPASLEQHKTPDLSVMEVDSDNESSRQDDTFSFKQQKTVPGGFGQAAIIEDDVENPLFRSVERDTGSEHSALSEDEVSDNEMDIAGSFPAGKDQNTFDSPNKPTLLPTALGTPGKALLDFDGDWAEQLQRTISPRKQNRDQLREQQNKILLDRVYSPIKPQSAVQKKDFRTSLDVMNAIFDGPERRTRASKGTKGGIEADFEV